MNFRTMAGLALTIAGGLAVSAQVPRQINYQGRLMDGTNLVNATVSAAFRLFTTAAGGTALYGQTGSVIVADGLYATTVGDGTPAFGQLFTNQPLYLEVGINGTALQPRERIQSVAYALRADGVSTGAITMAMIAPGAVGSAQLATNSVTAGKLAPGAVGATALAAGSVGGTALQGGAVTPDKLSERYWALDGNTDSVAGVSFLGTANAQALDIRVNNLRVMRYQPNNANPSIVGGHPSNSVKDLTYGAVVAGGGDAGKFNRVSDDFGAVGGGRGNRAGDNDAAYDNAAAATVAGGEDNLALDAHTAVGGGLANRAGGEFAVVGGGYSNQASGLSTTVAGGWKNEAYAQEAVIGGGRGNTNRSDFGVVAGGMQNLVEERYASVGGGMANWATGIGSTIGGGRHNRAEGLLDSTVGGGVSNQASGKAGTVAGGEDNLAIDDYGTVGGGQGNEAGTRYGVVAGGFSNRAAGEAATVGGGFGNEITGWASTIAGGNNNQAGDDYVAVGGGQDNEATARAGTVGGGYGNRNSDMFGVIGGGFRNIVDNGFYGALLGGYSNRVSGSYGVIGGGLGNGADGDFGAVAGGLSNRAYGTASFVGGGRENEADSEAVVGGGRNNLAGGTYAVVPGGSENQAQARNSFAGGYRAVVDWSDDGTFLWSDRSSTSRFYSAGVNEFGIRAANGVRLAANSPGPGYNRTVGRIFRDNTIIAWGKISADGSSGGNSFGMMSSTNLAAGHYEIQLTAEAENAAQVVMVASPEIDGQPTSAVQARLAAVDQRSATNFYIYINNGAFTPTNNDFTFIVTGR